MKSVCVFCGSRSGTDPMFTEAARQVGRLLAESERTVVYGGGQVGLMGELANAALAAGGRVIGVIPRALAHKEVAHEGLTELRVVHSMHERKALMADLSDSFLTLPGGIGTLEEFFEIWTWGQLGLHSKPYGLLNVSNYFQPLLDFLDHTVQQRFVKPVHRESLFVDTDPRRLLERLASRPTSPFAPRK